MCPSWQLGATFTPSMDSHHEPLKAHHPSTDCSPGLLWLVSCVPVLATTPQYSTICEVVAQHLICVASRFHTQQKQARQPMKVRNTHKRRRALKGSFSLAVCRWTEGSGYLKSKLRRRMLLGLLRRASNVFVSIFRRHSGGFTFPFQEVRQQLDVTAAETMRLALALHIIAVKGHTDTDEYACPFCPTSKYNNAASDYLLSAAGKAGSFAAGDAEGVTSPCVLLGRCCCGYHALWWPAWSVRH